MAISKDRVKPPRSPESWKLNEIFATIIVSRTYLALVTPVYWAVTRTTFFEVSTSKTELMKRLFRSIALMFLKLQSHFKVRVQPLKGDAEVSSAVYLQVEHHQLGPDTRDPQRCLSFLDRPGALLGCAFVVPQLSSAGKLF